MSRFRLAAALLAAGLVPCGSAVLAGERDAVPALQPAPVPVQARHSFFDAYLNPKMAARLGDQRAFLASGVLHGEAQDWTRDPDSVERVEQRATSALKSAVKRYALERLNLVNLSVPIFGSGRGSALAADGASPGTRLRFGISHMAPRAEVLLPLASGRLSVGADARGRVSSSFETERHGLRLMGALDPGEKSATFGVTIGF